MMVTRKGTFGLFLNILYGYLVLFLVFLLYNGINIVASRLMGTAGTVVLGVEPILFGVFSLGFDLLLIQLKRTLGRALHRTAPKTTK